MKQKGEEDLKPIFWEERKAFNKLWHDYHWKRRPQISYSYDDRDAMFASIVLIFREG